MNAPFVPRLTHGEAEDQLDDGGCEFDDELDDHDGFEEFRAADREPDDQEIGEQNESLLRRQREFRVAAEFVAKELAQLPAVRKVVLFGSVAAPLKKEVPRFREFRRAGIKVWHECWDLDLAVWVSDLTSLRLLQRTRSRALNDLLAEKNIGVAHHQVEIFVMEPGTDRYLGRLCCFGACPKGKPDCDVAGCGAIKFLQQLKDFVFHGNALAPGRTVLLYEAGAAAGRSDDEGIPC